MKNQIRQWMRKRGYEITRIPEGASSMEVEALCRDMSLEIFDPPAEGEYRALCPPLAVPPIAVPPGALPDGDAAEAELIDNVSMRNYFRVERKDSGWRITDDYPGSHYLSRQRMLYGVYRRFLGDRLEGTTVLDVGCSSGYYAFFCSRLGAGGVLGIDARPEHARQFEWLHRLLALPDSCRYRHLDMERELPGLAGPYDLVLAQGVLYHVYDHPGFVRELYRLTGRLLVLEGDCSGYAGNVCLAKMEDTACLRYSIHGPAIYPSVRWMVELLRWAGFEQVGYVRLPAEIRDTWGFGRLRRAMLVALK